MSMKLDLFVKLKYESSRIIGIIYSMRGLLSDLNNYAWPAKLAICVRYGKWCQRFLLHQLALESCEFHPQNDILDGALCKMFFISTFSFFLVFKRDFNIWSADFICILASNTASDDVAN